MRTLSSSTYPLVFLTYVLLVILLSISISISHSVSAQSIPTRTFADADCQGAVTSGSITDTTCIGNVTHNYRVICSTDGNTFNITYYDTSDATCTGTTTAAETVHTTDTCINSTIKYDCPIPSTPTPTATIAPSETPTPTATATPTATETPTTTPTPTATPTPTPTTPPGNSTGGSNNTNSTSAPTATASPTTVSPTTIPPITPSPNTTASPNATTSPPTTASPTSPATSTPTVTVAAFPLTVRLYATAGCSGDADAAFTITNGVCDTSNAVNEAHLITCSSDGLRATDQKYISVGTTKTCSPTQLVSTRIWSAGVCEYNSNTKQYIRVDCPITESYATSSYPDEKSNIGKVVGWSIGIVIGACLITSLITYLLRGRWAGSGNGTPAGTTTDNAGNLVQMQVLEKNPDGVVP